MGIKFKKCLTLAAAVPLVLVGVASPASADVVQNSVVSDPIKTFIEPGGSVSVTYQILNEGQGSGDINYNCNASDQTSAVVKIVAPAGVTASPDSLIFDKCGKPATVVFSSATKGAYPITVQVTDSGQGRYQTEGAAFTLTVGNAAPVPSIGGVADGEVYGLGAVPRPTCSVQDDQALTDSISLGITPAPYDAPGAHTATCTYTDPGGKSGSATVSYTVASANNAPTVAVTGVTQGGAYPAATPPAVGCDADDADGPIADPSPTFTGSLNDRGIGERTATCSVTDERGATATQSRTYTLANSEPTVSVQGPAARDYAKADAPADDAFSCAAQDADQAVTGTKVVDRTGLNARGLGPVEVRCSVEDSDGGRGSDSRSFRIVNTAPSVAVTGVEDDRSYPAAAAPVAACSVSDPDEALGAPAVSFAGSDLNPRGIGTAVATCTVRDSDGEQGEASATYELTNTAPEVRVTGPTTASYVNGTQPAASAFGCEVTDADETGLSSTPDVDTSALVRGLGDVTVTCDAEDTDRAAAERDSFTYTITNSASSVAVTGVDRASYEIGSEPTVGCAVTDLEDGDSTGTAQVSRGALSHGLGTVTVTCDATDTDGAAAEQSRATYSVVDTGKPTISGQRTTPANAFGWNNGPVGVAFTCADAGGSGIASCTPATATVSTEGAGQSVTGTATDFGGNTATATVGGIDIDLTKPNVAALPGTTDKPVVTDGGSYTSGSVPTAPTCVASDALSGLAGACTVSPVVDKVGAQTLTLSATDKAGNTRTVTLTYTVKRKVTGFYSPVDLGGVVNTVKAGSVVPLKFEVFDGGVEETSTAVVKGGSVTAAQVGCTSTTSDDIEVLSPGATALRYDATGGQFIQNWQTPKVVGACYRVTMTTVDGATSVAMFKTK